MFSASRSSVTVVVLLVVVFVVVVVVVVVVVAEGAEGWQPVSSTTLLLSTSKNLTADFTGSPSVKTATPLQLPPLILIKHCVVVTQHNHKSSTSNTSSTNQAMKF